MWRTRIAGVFALLIFLAPLLSISFANAVELEGLASTSPVTAGGIGGQPAPNAMCPEGQVVVGVAISSSTAGVPSPAWGLYCKDVDESGTLGTASSQSNSTFVSIIGSGRTEIWCPQGQVAVGLQVLAGKVVNGGGLLCAPTPSLVGISRTAVEGTGNRVELACRGESVLVGVNVRASTGIERIGGYCASYRSFRVSYAANGGEGKLPSPKRVKLGESLQVEASTLSRQGYVFSGWSDGERTYRPFEVFYPRNINTVLRAAWKLLPPGRPNPPELLRDVDRVTVFVSRPPTGGTPNYFLVNSSNGTNCTILGSENSCVISNLIGGNEYSFTVIAGNDSGRSEESDPARTSTFDVPGAPQNLKIESVEQGIKVSWLAPAADGGSEIISYAVYTTLAGQKTLLCGALAPTTECLITARLPKRSFVISVFAVNEIGESSPSLANINSDGEAVADSSKEGERYEPSDDPSGTLDVVVAGLAILVIAGSASGFTATSPNREQKEISEVAFENLKAIKRGSRWGDASRTWQLPGGNHLMKGVNSLSSSVSPFSTVLGRTVVDGTYIRAMFGSLYLLLPSAGIVFGYAASRSVGNEILPPSVSWIIAIIALSALDAFSGLVAGIVFAVAVTLGAESLSVNALLLLVGAVAAMFAPSLIGSSIRPIRRYLTSGHDFLERVGDYAFASLIAGWAVAKMIKGLPALAERSLPITDYARTIGVWTFICMLARLALEDIAVWAYPRRLVDTSPEAQNNWKHYERVTPFIKTFLFVVLSAPFIGHSWALWVAVAIFFLAELVPLVDHKLPSLEFVQRYVPKGAFRALVLVVIGSAVSVWLQNNIQQPKAQISLGFVLLAIPTYLIKLLSVMGDTDFDHAAWRKSRGGKLLYPVAGLLVFVALAAHAWGTDITAWLLK